MEEAIIFLESLNRLVSLAMIPLISIVGIIVLIYFIYRALFDISQEEYKRGFDKGFLDGHYYGRTELYEEMQRKAKQES